MRRVSIGISMDMYITRCCQSNYTGHVNKGGLLYGNDKMIKENKTIYKTVGSHYYGKEGNINTHFIK